MYSEVHSTEALDTGVKEVLLFLEQNEDKADVLHIWEPLDCLPNLCDGSGPALRIPDDRKDLRLQNRPRSRGQVESAVPALLGESIEECDERSIPCSIE